MIHIQKIFSLEDAPQWDAWDVDENYYFIRYNRGSISVYRIGQTVQILYQKDSNPDGCMSYDKLCKELDSFMKFPEECGEYV